jgi:Transglycosylase
MVGALAIVLVVALLSPVALYLYGLTLLPADRDPEDPARVPPIARTLLWRELGGEAPPKLPVLNPYTHFTEPNGPRMNLAVGAGRSLLANHQVPRPWQPAFFASIVWTSRHWSTDEALSTILARAYYGHGFYGLDAASQGYFGVPATSLSTLETAQLVVLRRSATRFDPWCKNESNQKGAAQLAGQSGSLQVTRLQRAPEGACR